MQLLDYQNPAPPGGAPQARPSGAVSSGLPVSGSGLPQSGAPQSGAPTGTAATNGAVGSGPASLAVNNFAAQQTVQSEASDSHISAVNSPNAAKAIPTQSVDTSNQLSDESPNNGKGQALGNVVSDSPTPAVATMHKRQLAPVSSAFPSGGFGGPGGQGGPGGAGGPPKAITGAYAVLTYKTSSGSKIPPNVFNSAPNNQTDDIPIVCALGAGF
jgi:hypothetical protein